jgi:hypothetical protein
VKPSVPGDSIGGRVKSPIFADQGQVRQAEETIGAGMFEE